ncbi:enoyl-CoA hydratase domain-containing protein 2, mitochondrial [Lepisosteus oculatus]|uniref:enoyl-CoA hydratase domain-containing protein 2, mitochondrial n=1 Tax=Lepisosteus oculatus TaxID=7918 RepID=UPI003720C0C3
MTLLRKLSPWPCRALLAGLRPLSVGAAARAGAPVPGGEKRSGPAAGLLGSLRIHGRGLHSEPSSPDSVEVRLNRLDGEDTGVAEVVMCRQRARNALGKVFVSQMRELVSALHHDPAVRVVLFRSAVQGVFCAGADLKERAQMSNSEAELFVHGLRSMMTEIAVLPMPTIAALDGFALGGGLELALACDLRTAASSAQMGLIETTRGLLPGAGGSQRLPRVVGVAVAKELIFTGRRLGGAQALELGLVNRTVEQNPTGDAAHGAALDLAREILPQAPVAVRMAKEAMSRGSEVDISTGMAIEGMCYARVIPTRDRQEGMAAFIEKRPPRYTGE